jgi:hypothetical protein
MKYLKEYKEFITEGNRDPKSIQKEYKDLKKQAITNLRQEWSRMNKVGNPNQLDKEGLISDILRQRHGDKYVDAAFESLTELRSDMISGTSGRWIDSLENRKYELKKDVKGAQIGNFTNVLLPKGTIIYNLPGGVFADHFSLKNKYASRSSQGPQYFDKPTFKGIMIKQTPDILAAIEKNSKVLESLTEGTYNSKDHIGDTSDGQGSNAEIYKKGKGYYVVVSGEVDYDFTAKNDKELLKKLEDAEFDSTDILESVNEKLTESVIGIKTPGSFKPKTLVDALDKAKVKYKINRLSMTLSVLNLDKKYFNDAKQVVDDLGLSIMMAKESVKVNEASRRKVHKAAKQGSYPAVIVVVQDGKVIHQEPVSTPDVAPATFNVMQEKYPKALLHLEDNTGKRLFSESKISLG